MARTSLATQPLTRAGIVPSYTAANADGHSVANRGRTIVHVKNGGGSPITVTLITQATVGGRAVADDTITIAAGAEKMIADLDEKTYNTAGGVVQVDFSAVTSVTVAAFTL